ncbi:MAG TPA: serine hydrolase [Burkholderiaceae bacterium]|nr:serine hydrolase [Burkholderiaceae bacterium]
MSIVRRHLLLNKTHRDKMQCDALAEQEVDVIMDARQPDAAHAVDRRGALRALSALALSVGLPGSVRAALDASAIEGAAAEADLHSVLVWQSGRMMLEHYRRSKDRPVGDRVAREVTFGPDVLHDLRSISKSVVGLLVGQAVARGEIDVAAPVLDFYPALADLRRDGRENIRVSDLLDMASGLAWRETAATYGDKSNDESRLWWDGTPARYILDRPLVAPPGTLWNYNGGHTVLLAEILEQRSGRKLLDLARSDLLEPLGIKKWEWRTGAHTHPLAYAGLRLTPPDLLRLGRLVLSGGQWQGRQVVPAAWVAEMLQPSVKVGEGRRLRYAKQWWTGQVPRAEQNLSWTGGFGNGGQRLYVVPELELVVVMTAGAYNSERIGAVEFALLRQIVAAV